MMARAGPSLTEETYIRFLPLTIVYKLAETLDVSELWMRLARQIPKKPDLLFIEGATFEQRYEFRHTNAIAVKGLQRGRSCTEELLSDWGMQNCRVRHLIQALKKAELLSMSDYLESCLLQNDPKSLPDQQQSSGNTYNSSVSSNSCSINNNSSQTNATHGSQSVGERGELQGRIKASSNGPISSNVKLPVSVTNANQCFSQAFSTPSEGTAQDDLSHYSEAKPAGDENAIDEDLANVENELEIPDLKEHCESICYEILKKVTDNFNEKELKDGGRLIGKGGFGKVYLGKFHTGLKVAVKCLLEDDTGSDIQAQFLTEVKTLSTFKHENLVLLLGYSKDVEGHYCLIYQYMPNGSLEDRLACHNDTPPLSAAMRLEIARGTARGITYLHKSGLTHRDIKSANILLDAEFNPKVGDFATARVAPSGMTSKVMNGTAVIGTSCYLAPEAYTFKIHPGLDSFSFGVVLLELLTGLAAYDRDREEWDIKMLVCEHCGPADDEDEDNDDEDDDDDDDEEEEEEKKQGTIFDLLDPKAGEWDKDVVELLYSLSNSCLLYTQKKRMKMAVVLRKLEAVGISIENNTP